MEPVLVPKLQEAFDAEVSEEVALDVQREVSKPTSKVRQLPGHISPGKPVLVTIFEEEEAEGDAEVEKEIYESPWEKGDYQPSLEEVSDDELSVLRPEDLQKDNEGPSEDVTGDQGEPLGSVFSEDCEAASLKVDEESSVEEFSNPGDLQDKHFGRTQDNGGLECIDIGVHHFQSDVKPLTDEVLGGLRGLDGAIRLLQKARLDLLKQVSRSRSI